MQMISRRAFVAAGAGLLGFLQILSLGEESYGSSI